MVVATGWAQQSSGPTLPVSGSGQTADLSGAVSIRPASCQIDTTTVTGADRAGGDVGGGERERDHGGRWRPPCGAVVTLTVNLSQAVAVMGGTPTLSLNDGGTATYTNGTGTNTLNFSYTVAAGQNIADLAVTAVNLNGATVTNNIPTTVTGGSGQSLTDPNGHVWSFGAANGYGYAILRDGVQYANGSERRLPWT